MNARELDSELRRWADSHTSEEEQLVELRQRIHAEAGAPLPAVRFERREPSWLGRFAWAVAGAAMAMVLMHLVRRPRPTPQAQHLIQEDSALALVRATAIPNAGFGEVFAETRRLFPQRLRWVADTDQDFLVNVSETVERPLAEAAGFADVRLVAIVRRPGEEWRVLWRTVVVTQDGGYVTVALPGGGTATIWAHAADATTVAVETRLALPEVSTSVSRILPADAAEPLVLLKTSEKELRVYQTATPVSALPQA